VGHRATLPAARPRRIVWLGLPLPGRSDGHNGGRDGTTLTLAEPYVERVIGSIQRECLDHIVIFNERHLRRRLTSYRGYYHRSRTHLSLRKDCPDPRPVQSENRVIAIEEVGGLHHRYERLAA